MLRARNDHLATEAMEWRQASQLIADSVQTRTKLLSVIPIVHLIQQPMDRNAVDANGTLFAGNLLQFFNCIILKRPLHKNSLIVFRLNCDLCGRIWGLLMRDEIFEKQNTYTQKLTVLKPGKTTLFFITNMRLRKTIAHFMRI